MRKSVLFVARLFMLFATTIINAQSFCNSTKIVDIQCGQTISGSTNTGSNTFSAARYATCLDATSQTPFSANDVIYRFVVPQPTRVEVNLTGLTADLDVFIFRDCGEGATCIQTSAQSNNTPEKIVFENLSGTYYIIVDGYNPSQKSDFTVSITCGTNASCDPNPCANATAIQCGQTVTSNNNNSGSRFSKACSYGACYSGNVSYAGNDKIYRLDVTPGTSQLELILSGLSTNLDIFLFKGDCLPGSCVATGLKTGTNSESISIPYPSGTYYVVVDGPEVNQKSNFTLKVNCTTNGINCNQAENLACGQTYKFSNINSTNSMAYNNYGTCISDENPVLNPYSGNDRLFKINVPAGRTLEIKMTGLSADLDMFLFDACDNVVILNAPAGQNGLKTCVARSFEPGNVDEKIVIENASGEYYLAVDAPTPDRKSDFTLSISCQNPCPPALNADCQDISFYYSGIRDGGYVYTFVAKENLPTGKWTVTTPTGAVTETQDAGKTVQFRFFGLGNYIVCYEYQDSNGCTVKCCKTVCVVDPYKCTNISSTRTNSGYTLNVVGYTAQNVIEWRDDQSEQILGTKTNSINIAAPAPGNCRNICAYLYDPVSKCYTVCCIEVCTPACAPANNDCDNVTFSYSGNNGSLNYTFSVPANFPNGKWIATGGQYGNYVVTLGNSKTISYTFPSAGKYKIGYEYSDANGCSIQCFKTICIQNPYACNLITSQKTGDNFRLTLSNVATANVKEWRDAQTNAVIGTNTSFISVPVPAINSCKSYTVLYFDANAGCYTVCAVTVCGPTCAPANLNCNNITFVYTGTANALTHKFSVPASLPEGTWVVTGNNITEASRVISRDFIFTFPSAGTYKVCYTYKDSNGCEIECCQTVCVANPYACNLITTTRTSAGFSLTLPGVSANNIVQWRNEQNNTSLGTQLTTVNVPQPGLNTSNRYTVIYFEPASNCYRVCGVIVSGPTCAPANLNCNNITFVYTGTANALTHKFSVPASLPEGTWVVTGNNITEASRVISRDFIFTFPSAGTYKVCYTYKDSNGCEIECCQTVCAANPYACNLITATRTSAGFSLTLPGVSANNIVQWRNEQNNTSLGTQLTTVNVPQPALNTSNRYTVIYFEPASNCYRVCGVIVNGPSCAPANLNCNNITFVYTGTANALTHKFSVPASLPEGTWVVTGNNTTEASRVISRDFIFTFPSAGTYKVCYTYKDSNGCEIECCQTVCVADPYACNLITTTRTSAGFSLTLPGVSANNIVQWRNEQNNTSLGTQLTTVNVPQPGLNTSNRYTVIYFEPASNCYRVCGVVVSGATCPPTNENCSNITFTYSGTNGSLRYTFTAANSLPAGTWVVNIGNSEGSRVVGRTTNLTFQSPGTYQVCYIYTDVNGCDVKCCQTVCVANPYQCNNINVVRTSAGFNLNLPGINSNNIVQWRNEQNNTTLGLNSTISVVSPPVNVCHNYTVQYFDPASNCYRVCGVTVCGPNCPAPDENCTNVSFTYTGGEGSLRYSFIVPQTLPNGTWTATGGQFGNSEVVIGQDRAINYTFPAAGTYTVCFKYKDSNGCEIKCCKTICVVDPFACNRITATRTNNGFNLIISGINAGNILQWYDNQTGTVLATTTTSTNIGTVPVNTCRSISVLYFDVNTRCYAICSIKVCGETCPAPDNNCNSITFDYNGTNGTLLYSFAVPSSLPNSGTWTATGGQFGNVEASIGQGRNINYTFTSVGTYKICYKYTNSDGCAVQCCKTICVTDPFACSNLQVTPNQNSYIISLAGYPTNAISQWVDEDINQTIAASVTSVAIPAPAPGQCRRISVLIFDASSNCYRICGQVICEPENACGLVNNIAASCSGDLLDLNFNLKNNTGVNGLQAQFIVVAPAGLAFEDCNNVKSRGNIVIGDQNVKLQLRNCAFPLKQGAVVTIYVTLIDDGQNFDDLYCPLEPITFVIPECRECISQTRIVSCPTVFDPVCGCNNITYNNSCEAEREGVTTWSAGACPGTNVNNTPSSESRAAKPSVNYELNNAPNPFSGSTMIRFNLPSDMDATVSVLDMDGKVVFEESGTFVAGWNEVHFEETINLSGGMYFYRLQTEEQVLTKTMVLTKE